MYKITLPPDTWTNDLYWQTEDQKTLRRIKRYKINSDNTIPVTGCDSSAIAVTIPEKINGVPVTSIDNSAFSGCSGLTSVTIPATIAEDFVSTIKL